MLIIFFTAFIFTWAYSHLSRVPVTVCIIQSGAGMPSMSLTDVKKKKRNYSNLALKKCIHSTEKYFEKTSTRESFKRLQVLFTFLSDVKPKNK